MGSGGGHWVFELIGTWLGYDPGDFGLEYWDLGLTNNFQLFTLKKEWRVMPQKQYLGRKR